MNGGIHPGAGILLCSWLYYLTDKAKHSTIEPQPQKPTRAAFTLLAPTRSTLHPASQCSLSLRPSAPSRVTPHVDWGLAQQPQQRHLRREAAAVAE
mmetsp:Transcript_23921/g.46981  ORF Transcript_23921/g.46981 Transcript_23921/m.46981 type:complete len:96 (+) Transcript_23921:45-332(+)